MVDACTASPPPASPCPSIICADCHAPVEGGGSVVKMVRRVRDAASIILVFWLLSIAHRSGTCGQRQRRAATKEGRQQPPQDHCFGEVGGRLGDGGERVLMLAVLLKRYEGVSGGAGVSQGMRVWSVEGREGK